MSSPATARIVHALETFRIEIPSWGFKRLHSRDISMWFADGSNYPGTANIRQRKSWFEEGLKQAHSHLSPEQRSLVEYKPFEPALYHTDIADWGMALHLARTAGAQAKVLVDTGHHYHSQNVEQIVAWLLSEQMLGGFHFNDRCYANDDLTIGSIDLQTGTVAQQLFAKAALVDHEALAHAQTQCDLIAAESLLQDAFNTDVRPTIQQEWRSSKGLPRASKANSWRNPITTQANGRSDGTGISETF